MEVGYEYLRDSLADLGIDESHHGEGYDLDLSNLGMHRLVSDVSRLTNIRRLDLRGNPLWTTLWLPWYYY